MTSKKIKGFDNYTIDSNGTVRNKNGKMKVFHSKDGYERVTLSSNGIKSNHYIHILVGSHFIEHPKDTTKIQIDHKNRKRTDNTQKNLRFVTPKQNSNNRKKK